MPAVHTPGTRPLFLGLPVRGLSVRLGHPGVVVPDAREAGALGAYCSWLSEEAAHACAASPHTPTQRQPYCRDVARVCPPAAVPRARCAQESITQYWGIPQVTNGGGLAAQGEAATGLALMPQG